MRLSQKVAADAVFVSRRNSLCRDVLIAKQDAALARYNAACAAEPLPTLFADDCARAERLIELGFGEDAIAAEAATNPCAEWLLVHQGIWIEGLEFGRQ